VGMRLVKNEAPSFAEGCAKFDNERILLQSSNRRIMINWKVRPGRLDSHKRVSGKPEVVHSDVVGL